MLFMDHCSCLRKIHQQKWLSYKTLEAKRVFKAILISLAIWYIIIFAAMIDLHTMWCFWEAFISFFSVNAHFQNVIAEKAIRSLQEQAQKQILHASGNTYIALVMCTNKNMQCR